MKHPLHKNKKGGFTLIELMVVISIIAVIASILYSSFGTAKADARDTTRSAETDQLRTALTEYAADHNGEVPAGSAAAGCGNNGTSWVCNSTSPQGLSVVLAPLVSGKYISSIPNDPVNSGGLAYYYVSGLQDATDPSTGASLAQGASFRYVSETQSAASTSPVLLGDNIGDPDYVSYPGGGYPVGTNSSYSQLPQPPTNVFVEYAPQHTTFLAHIIWTQPTNDSGSDSLNYNIYSSAGVLLGSTSGVGGGFWNEGEPSIGYYSFYVTTVNSSGESAPSATVQ